MAVLHPFISVLGISKLWEDDYEGLCVMTHACYQRDWTHNCVILRQVGQADASQARLMQFLKYKIEWLEKSKI